MSLRSHKSHETNGTNGTYEPELKARLILLQPLLENVMQLEGVGHAEQHARAKSKRPTFSVRREFNPIAEGVSISQSRLQVRRHRRDRFLFVISWVAADAVGQ